MQGLFEQFVRVRIRDPEKQRFALLGNDGRAQHGKFRAPPLEPVVEVHQERRHPLVRRTLAPPRPPAIVAVVVRVVLAPPPVPHDLDVFHAGRVAHAPGPADEIRGFLADFIRRGVRVPTVPHLLALADAEVQGGLLERPPDVTVL